MSAGRHATIVAVAALGYTALAVWLTWPLATSLTVRLPCPGPMTCAFDTVYSAWAAGWVSHALLTQAPIGAANIYYPTPDALFYGPGAFGVVPYALPVFAATGNAAAAINVAFLLCAALTALALHWVVWRWTASHLAGFVSAWAFLMNPWFLWDFVGSVPHLAAIQYLPLIVYLAARPLERWPPAVLLSLLIVVQCLTDPVYVAPAILAPLSLLALARLLRHESRPSGWRLTAALAGSLACVAPFVVGYARVRASNPSSPYADREPLLQPFAGLLPTDLSSLLWRGPDPTTMPPAMLGVIVAGGLVATVRWWRQGSSGLGPAWRPAALWAIVGTCISITPIVTFGNPWWSEWRVPLPHYVLLPLGFYEVIRAPARLGVAGMIGLCLLAGVAFSELTRALGAWSATRNWRRPLAIAAAATVAVCAYLFPSARHRAIPSRYPLQNAPWIDPQVLAALRAGEGPVLELPAVHRRGRGLAPPLHAAAMYRSTFHWRPLLNGYSSYWPAGFYERMLLTEQLPAASALRALVCQTGVRTIVVDRLQIPNRFAWLHGRPSQELRLMASTPAVLVFDVTMPLPGEPGGPDCTPFATHSASG